MPRLNGVSMQGTYPINPKREAGREETTTRSMCKAGPQVEFMPLSIGRSTLPPLSTHAA